MDTTEIPKRQKKVTVLAFGEGEDERIFLRHLSSSYCRKDKVTVASSSAGGGDPLYIVERAIRYAGSEKRNFQFILLDTDKVWTEEMIQLAEKAEMELLGSEPCLEAFFLDILRIDAGTASGAGRFKDIFEQQSPVGNFNEEKCRSLFTKAVLNEARKRISLLNHIIEVMEGVNAVNI